MSKDKITDAIGGIGDDLILEAKKNRSGIIMFRRIAAAAACMALLVGVFCLTFPKDEDGSIVPILQNTTAPTFTPHRPSNHSAHNPSPSYHGAHNKQTYRHGYHTLQHQHNAHNQQPATGHTFFGDHRQEPI